MHETTQQYKQHNTNTMHTTLHTIHTIHTKNTRHMIRTTINLPGSAMCLITTGMPYSQMKIFLSSELEIKRRFWSMNVTVLTASMCSSYFCTISLARRSHCTISLFFWPAKHSFCCSGWNLAQKGTFLLVWRLITCPVSVSHNLMKRS